MATVLVVDRDTLHLELLTFLLKQSGHRVFTAQDAEAAFEILQARAIDLITIETAHQPQDGVRLCQQIRRLNPRTPMMIVSERIEEEQIVHGLVSAADDYIKKPFSPHEFLARVQALLRRSRLTRAERAGDDSIVIGEITLDQHHMAAVVRGHPVPLTPRELSLLRAFMEHPDRVLSREQLMELAWGSGFVVTSKAIDVYVLRLRQKIAPHLSGDFYIHALRGFGYRFSPSLEVIASDEAAS